MAPRNFALRDLVDDVEDDDMALPTPPSTRGTKKRGSDTARKVRSMQTHAPNIRTAGGTRAGASWA